MPQYLSPGVYVEEVDSGSRPIEGVGTAVAAFVGLATRGPFNTPTLISNWTQFTATFGDFTPGTYLAHAVFGYFMNGGGNCYVVRIGDDGGNARPTVAPRSRPTRRPLWATGCGPSRSTATCARASWRSRSHRRAVRRRPTTCSSWSSSAAARSSRSSTA